LIDNIGNTSNNRHTRIAITQDADCTEGAPENATNQHAAACRNVTGGLFVESERDAVTDETARSFDDYVRDHQVALVRYATLLCGSRALGEDLVQEVLIRLYGRWAQLTDPHPYVRRSVTNEYLSWRRRWSTRHIHAVPDEMLKQHPVEPAPPWGEGPDPELWASLQLLPRQQRAAVVLRFYEGFDDAEIATVLGCKEGTVRGHISRGLAMLRAALQHPNEVNRDA
jgi:RNA polymerase sigma-70 factor (sigma-E family)